MIEHIFENATVIVRTAAKKVKKATKRSPLKWKLLSRTHHLSLKANDSLVWVFGYIHRDEFLTNAALGDILCREMEIMSDNMEDLDGLGKEAAA